MTAWLILDMDQGVIRREKSRRTAVAWLVHHTGGTVLARRTYGPGAYTYRLGWNEDDSSSNYFVETEAAAVRGGWDHWFTVPDLYPYRDRPHATDSDLDRDQLIETMWKQVAS